MSLEEIENIKTQLTRNKFFKVLECIEQLQAENEKLKKEAAEVNKVIKYLNNILPTN